MVDRARWYGTGLALSKRVVGLKYARRTCEQMTRWFWIGNLWLQSKFQSMHSTQISKIVGSYWNTYHTMLFMRYTNEVHVSLRRQWLEAVGIHKFISDAIRHHGIPLKKLGLESNFKSRSSSLSCRVKATVWANSCDSKDSVVTSWCFWYSVTATLRRDRTSRQVKMFIAVKERLFEV